MIASYFDLGTSNPALQKAAAQTLATQAKNHTAIAPQVDLSTAISQAMSNQRAGQQLALQQHQSDQQAAIAQGRLNLDTQKQAFDEGQLPWATVGGALGAAASLYGGYRSLQDSEALKKLAEGNQD